ncbi:unnamed protein product [Didymodactylos carnosus]|nr:unnamed protein product [Didymodactylos carnosus]CAF4176185.1 unnamed protein product [Didymodactylos carnosus]
MSSTRHFYHKDAHGVKELISQDIYHREMELLAKYYVDSNKDQNESTSLSTLLSMNKSILNLQTHCCVCKQTLEFYDRSKLEHVIYHGRSYKRRGSTNNYTIGYHYKNGEIHFGYIEYFVNCKCDVKIKINKLK